MTGASDVEILREPGEAAAVNAALQAAADEIERELICCPDGELEPHHHICRWGQASRRIVLSHMTSPPDEKGRRND